MSGGLHCETEVVGCMLYPCQNGGTCINRVNGYTCMCPPPFTDPHCQTRVDECIPNPCLNGGMCTIGVDGYSCDCQPEFSGDHCEIKIDTIGTDAGTCIR